MSFTHKHLKFDFALSVGNFQGGGNTASVTGLRASATIVKAGGLSQGGLQFAIYGLSLSTMNQLSTYGQTLTLTGRNTVTVTAYEDGQRPPPPVFVGNITSAFMDGNSQPQVAFRGEAFAGGDIAIKPTMPTTKPGSQDGAALLQSMAQAAGLQFENNAVSARIQNPYYPGTAVQQIEALCEHIGCEHIIDNGKLAIWPSSGSRSGSMTIGPQSGLVGYPAFNSQGVVFKTLFDPNLTYGASVQLQSSLTPANGTWIIHKLEYELESETPQGNWFAIVEAHRIGEMPVA